jgi:hypothetical protein
MAVSKKSAVAGEEDFVESAFLATAVIARIVSTRDMRIERK